MDIALKFIEYIRASRVPLRNWYNFSEPGILHTRITVPFSDADASMVPVELIDRKEMGALWACITLATVSVRVEKSMISPDCCTAGGWEDADDCWERGDVGDGTGEGYAK